MERDPLSSPASAESRHPDARQFELIYKEHSNFVYNLAYRLTGSPGEADDLLQDTFLRVYRYLGGYAGGSFKSWLRRIVVNLFFTKCRSSQRNNHLSLESEREDGGQRRLEEALLDRSGDPALKMEQVSLDDRLQISLDSIPEEYRVALILRELDDLSYDQIAATLGVPIGTV
jgi:RNA polymerase sigma factor (sigma-70 family)